VDLGMTGHVAFVTGGTRGIGRAICRALAAEGCHVGFCARDSAAVQRTAAELSALGARIRGDVADVTVPGAVERSVEATAEEFGEIHHVVANVGGTVGQASLDATAEDWIRTFDLNAGHAIRVIRAAVPHMRAPEESSIVIVSSISGWKPGRERSTGRPRRLRSSRQPRRPGSLRRGGSG